MADYSKYNEKQYNNQKTYLENLSRSGTAGQAAWAKSEMNKLNSQYNGGSSSSSSSSSKPTATTPASSSKPAGSSGSKSTSSSKNTSSSSSKNNSSGSGGSVASSSPDYSKYNEKQYNNQKTYLENIIAAKGGSDIWAEAEMEKLNSQYQGNKNNTVTNNPVVNNVNKPATVTPAVQPVQPTQPVQQWDTSGKDWTNMSGANGLNYAISGLNGTIITTDANGQQTRYLPTDANFDNMYAELQQQTGNSYVPTYNWTTANGTDVTTKNYLLGNSDLRYALEQWMKENNSNTYDIEGYAKDMYNRVGTQREDGSVVTLADVDKELDRLGLSDYNSQNVYHTSGGNLIPNNPFVTTKEGSFGGSNSPDSQWVSYGGQDYLIGGDSANFIDFVNGKTGNTTNLDFIFDDMANNPYAKEDAEFAQSYLDALNQFNASAGIQAPTAGSTVTGGSYTGYDDVDQFIDYANSINGFNQATGTTGSDIWSEIKAMLEGGYESQQAFIDSQRTQAEQNAEDLMRQAYVANKLQGDSVKEAMSAAGLGTTGAMQSAMLDVQSNYNDNVADIRSNLASMIANFDEQKLKALTDYMNKSTDFYYQIQNDQQDQAYKNAQLYMQQMEMQRAQEQQDWDNAYKQQLLDFEKQQYADSQTQSQSDTDYDSEQDVADYYNRLVGGSKTPTVNNQTQQQVQTMAEQLEAQYGEALPPTVMSYLSQAFAKNQKPDLNVLNAYLGIN